MEISCPSCGAKHRTEDYPGAFEIQCACGYSILVPDEASLAEAPAEDLAPLPDFEGAPMAMEQLHEDAKVPLAEDATLDPSLMAAQAQEGEHFSALDLTPPEQLPEEMPYDPFELQNQWPQDQDAAPGDFSEELPSSSEQTQASVEVAPAQEPASSTKPESPTQAKAVEAQDLVKRIQLASIGYMHGALFDIELGDITDTQAKTLAERCTKFLESRPWLREHLDKGFDKPETLFKEGRLPAIPELLSVEIYLNCAQQGIVCSLRAHTD